jgi:hypothetical protein
MTQNEGLIQVTVTRDDVAGIPASARGAGSMLVLQGTTGTGNRVFFKASGRLANEAMAAGSAVIELEPRELLVDGAE